MPSAKKRMIPALPPTARFSVPELDDPVPAGRGHLARLVRVPQNLDAHVVVSLPLGEQLGRLPVPDVDLAVAVTAGDVALLRGEVYAARIPGHHVTLEHLLPQLLEAVADLVDGDLVVEALARDELAVGGGGDGRHGVHGGVSDVLHVHRDVPLPDTERLVVG